MKINQGSIWRRWEPHIHAPGTVLEDKYGGENAWEKYVTALECVTPTLTAIGLTDYYSVETYKRLRREREANGRLKHCELLFPNVEMRLDVGTKKGNQVNIHLLVDPASDDHVEELERFLARLRFSAYEDEFVCSRADLIRLGRRHAPHLKDDDAAFAEGANQFKVSRKALVDCWRDIAWARENILIAVSGGADGSSGVAEASDATLRREIERSSHIIFASSPSQRAFWLREGKEDARSIRDRFGSLKPCLWGSDAHEFGRIGRPDLDHFCWIKGRASFDSLRQACIDPHRAYVGEHPPSRVTASQVIEKVSIQEAVWAKTPELRLNSGLIAIIGARGSGKTALADIIATGCESYRGSDARPSFLARAREHLRGSTVAISWADGTEGPRSSLHQPETSSSVSYDRVRYLSQQFVEELCSIEGMPRLIEEIERVIVEAHSQSERNGAATFNELLYLRTNGYREARENDEAALAEISDSIGLELEKKRLLPTLTAQIKEKESTLSRYERDKLALMPKGPNVHAARLQEVEDAYEKVLANVRHFSNKEADVAAIRTEVANLRANTAPSTLRGMKSRHPAASLSDEEWSRFLLVYQGDVDALMKDKAESTSKSLRSWTGQTPKSPLNDGSFVSRAAELSKQPLAILEAERDRLQKLVAADIETRMKLAAVTRRITEERAAKDALKLKHEDYSHSQERASKLVVERERLYTQVFDSVLAEERTLRELYAPLVRRLTEAGGSLSKLSFSVSRIADHVAWAKRGQSELFDLRSGPFKGIGSLAKTAETELKSVWEHGTSAEVAAAMKRFRDNYQDALLDKAPYRKTDEMNYRSWTRRFAQWLYSTEHISLQYGVQYEGTDIKKLSPGTRGIVLLMLYLALDGEDDRPLIIDQPEENLDPRSIYYELVPMFQRVKQHRQVIMVTHNANLVVNADADQIIITSSGKHSDSGLPPITYEAGGLDETRIREMVCSILEGGEEAFKERARRLRVTLAS